MHEYIRFDFSSNSFVAIAGNQTLSNTEEPHGATGRLSGFGPNDVYLGFCALTGPYTTGLDNETPVQGMATSETQVCICNTGPNGMVQNQRESSMP